MNSPLHQPSSALRLECFSLVDWAKRSSFALLGLALVCWMHSEPVWAETTSPEFRSVFKAISLAQRTPPGETDDSGVGGANHVFLETSARLQLMGAPLDGFAYQVDYRLVRQEGQLAGMDAPAVSPFRRFDWQDDLEQLSSENPAGMGQPYVRWGHEIDRAEVVFNKAGYEIALGRHPLTWGAGRVWLPTDLFAAFSPLEVDTEYKPGVDGVFATWYPTDLSSVMLVHVLSPKVTAGSPDSSENTVARLRLPYGEESELTFLGGSLRGEQIVGGSIETAGWGAGWRTEAVRWTPRDSERSSEKSEILAIAGLDFSTDGGELFFIEAYHATAGASKETELLDTLASPAFTQRRIPQLSRSLLGLGTSMEFWGLWNFAYLGFLSPLESPEGERVFSTLHQLVLAYSLGNNAEATVFLVSGSGPGTNGQGIPRSEFGHVPDTLYLSVKFVL